MTKPFLRSILAGFAAAGFAVAQTPPPALSPTSTPPAPAPVQRVAFKQVPPPAPLKAAPAKDATPASKPNESQCVRVQVRLITLPVGNAAVKNLFAADRGRVKPRPVSLTADELFAFMERVAGDRQGSVMQAPRMTHLDRQSMDFRVGDDLPFDTGRGTVRVFVGTACRMTPAVAADGKSVELAVDFTHTERDGGAEADVRNLKTLAVKDTFHLPVGGSTAVRLGTRTVTSRTEFGPPVLSQIPYLNRLFKNVGVCEVESDVVAVFTAEAVLPPDESFIRVAKLDKPAPVKLSTKVFDVADLVGPPTDSPLAQPADDVAMKAAVKAYREVRAEQLMKQVRDMMTAASWEENGGSGKMAFSAHRQSLVVNGSAEILTHVGECLTAVRETKRPPVFVQMVVLSAKSDHPAVRKLLDKKPATPLTPEEVKALLLELKKDGAADTLSRPQLMLRNKQTGFFQVGQQFPRLTGTAPPKAGEPAVQNVEYVNTGLVIRMTPDVSADGKFVRLMAEVCMTEPSSSRVALGNGQFATPIDSQSVESTLVVPDGGTMAVNVGTKKVEQRVEHKLPVLGDLPYVGRLFRNVGVTHERRDTIVVATVTTSASVEQLIEKERERMKWAVAPEVHANPLPVAAPAMPIRVVGQELRLTAQPGTTIQRCEPPVVPPLPAMLPPQAVPPMMPVPAPVAAPAEWGTRWIVHPTPSSRMAAPVAPPMAIVPQPAPPRMPTPATAPAADSLIMSRFGAPVPGPTFNFNTTGPDGLERVGIDFDVNIKPTATSVLAPVADPLMAAYKAACVAGRKDEAARLALQLLAKDPTCFGRDK